MSIDASITSRSRQILVLTVRNVEVRFWVTVFLGETKIDDIDLISTLPDAHQEIIRLDVTVNEGLCVNVFNPGDKLIREK